MLKASSEAAQKRAVEMQRIAASKEMQTIWQMYLPNTGASFSEISRNGLASIRQDRGIFKAGIK
ncbi:MAG: hypothetical protein H7834_09815 [Magnetococcus sp. YQC-9]